MASIVGAAALLVAAPGPRQAPADRFIVKDVMIPARDGVKSLYWAEDAIIPKLR